LPAVFGLQKMLDRLADCGVSAGPLRDEARCRLNFSNRVRHCHRIANELHQREVWEIIAEHGGIVFADIEPAEQSAKVSALVR
jgi:hypothetical protein